MGFADVWGLVRKIERLLELEAVHGDTLAELKASYIDLDRRIARLETREDIVVNEAKAAARSASSEATQGVIVDLARRIGMLEASPGGPPRLPRD